MAIENKTFVADLGHGCAKCKVYWPLRGRDLSIGASAPRAILEIMQPSISNEMEQGGFYVPPESIELNRLDYIRMLHAHLSEVLEYVDATVTKESLKGNDHG